MSTLTPDDPTFPYHGTTTGYARGCKCTLCKRARADYVRDFRARARNGKVKTPDRVHGTDHGYTRYGCKCEPCTNAHAAAWRNWNRKTNQSQNGAFALTRDSVKMIGFD